MRVWNPNPEHVEGAGEAKVDGYLEDYAYLIEGPQELYQTNFDPRRLVAAQQLAEFMINHVRAPGRGSSRTALHGESSLNLNRPLSTFDKRATPHYDETTPPSHSSGSPDSRCRKSITL